MIGGNSDREYFFAPDNISKHITEQTCEHCNSYNMLRLTRHLFSWKPEGALFDYYERTHFNHILAQQNPSTGMFTYMTPLMSGAAREFSRPTEDFWCCGFRHREPRQAWRVHLLGRRFRKRQHAVRESLHPRRSHVACARGEAQAGDRISFTGQATLRFASLGKGGRFALALRIPSWATDATVSVKGWPA